MNLETFTEDDTTDMNWALTLKQDTHKIDRLHLKCGVALPDGRIAVLARGKPEGCAQQISGVILYFQPKAKADDPGKYDITLLSAQTQRHFPSIFPRQLDHLQVIGTKLIAVQDTPDEAKFEAFSIDMAKERVSQPYHRLHFRGIFDSPEATQ